MKRRLRKKFKWRNKCEHQGTKFTQISNSRYLNLLKGKREGFKDSPFWKTFSSVDTILQKTQSHSNEEKIDSSECVFRQMAIPASSLNWASGNTVESRNWWSGKKRIFRVWFFSSESFRCTVTWVLTYPSSSSSVVPIVPMLLLLL